MGQSALSVALILKCKRIWCVWFRPSSHRSEQQAASTVLSSPLCSHHPGGEQCESAALSRTPPRLGLLHPLRMDLRRAEPERNTGSNPVSLYGEFTLTGNRKVRYAVSLTERDLTVQRLTPTPVGRNKVVLSLKDCVGCRAYRENDNADPAAYLSAYFYPLRRRWMSSGVSRQRVEHCFRLAALQDPRANLEEAEKWARAVRERAARQQYLRNGECSLATRGKVCFVISVEFKDSIKLHTAGNTRWNMNPWSPNERSTKISMKGTCEKVSNITSGH